MIVEPRPDHLAHERPQLDHSSLPSFPQRAARVSHPVVPPSGVAGAPSPTSTRGPSMVGVGPAGPALATHHRGTAIPVDGPAVNRWPGTPRRESPGQPRRAAA